MSRNWRGCRLGLGDGYQYDPSDEVTGCQRDGTLNGDGTVSASFWNNTGIHYDNNGNRTQVTGSGANSYVINDLNQYTSDAVTGTMGYDPKGNLTSAAGWIYTYDAQNRLTRMETGGTVIVQTYDPLNRVITRAVNGAITQNVWEGWNLIEEHRPDWSIQRCYLQGANQNEMVAAFDGGVYTTHWFWQDGRGNTSHITGDNAALLERYTYDLNGAPKFYDEWGNERLGGSVYDARFLFAGSQYLPETGLYDMRNRFYYFPLGRFMQTDPIGFAGDALNLYRYCGDDPVDRSDPTGLLDINSTGSHTSLTSFDDGDWVKGSDGLTDWDRDHLMRPQAGMDGGGGGGDNGAGGGGKSIASENEGKKNLTFASQIASERFTSWEDAGIAGAATAIPMAHSDPQHREYFGKIGQSISDPHVFAYGPPMRGSFNRYSDGKSKGGWYNLSEFGKAKLPNGFKQVGGYWALPHHQLSWPKGDQQRLYEGRTNAVLGIPAPPGAHGAEGHNTFKIYEYVPGLRPPSD